MSNIEKIQGRIDPDVTKGLAISNDAVKVPAFKSMHEVLEFAKIMSVSGVAVRKHLRGNPGACAAIIMQAMRWEMDPYLVGNKSFEVNDQIAYESQLITAVINTRAPIRGRLKTRFTGKGQQRQCIAYATMIGDDVPTEVESPELGAIKPQNSPLWKTDPDQQLAYYTKRAWARRECPEVLLGVYDREEIEGGAAAAPMVDVTPTARPKKSDFEAEQKRAEEIRPILDELSLLSERVRDVPPTRVLEEVEKAADLIDRARAAGLDLRALDDLVSNCADEVEAMDIEETVADETAGDAAPEGQQEPPDAKADAGATETTKEEDGPSARAAAFYERESLFLDPPLPPKGGKPNLAAWHGWMAELVEHAPSVEKLTELDVANKKTFDAWNLQQPERWKELRAKITARREALSLAEASNA